MAAVRLSPAVRAAWWVHRQLLRLSGGRLGTRLNGMPILLLTTVGRRSGEPRTAALQYLSHGRGWAVIASHAGDDRHPAWWLNLATDPAASVTRRGRSVRVRARETTGAERDELLARFAAIDPAYAEYPRRTRRRIPVVVLEPEDGAS